MALNKSLGNIKLLKKMFNIVAIVFPKRKTTDITMGTADRRRHQVQCNLTCWCAKRKLPMAFLAHSAMPTRWEASLSLFAEAVTSQRCRTVFPLGRPQAFVLYIVGLYRDVETMLKPLTSFFRPPFVQGPSADRSDAFVFTATMNACVTWSHWVSGCLVCWSIGMGLLVCWSIWVECGHIGWREGSVF